MCYLKAVPVFVSSIIIMVLYT